MRKEYETKPENHDTTRDKSNRLNLEALQHLLKSYDGSQPDILRAEIATQPESISIYFPNSRREILIEQSSGVLQVRAYDGEHDSPLSTLIPVLGPMYIDSRDYESEIK